MEYHPTSQGDDDDSLEPVNLTRSDLSKLQETVNFVQQLSKSVVELQNLTQQLQVSISKMPTTDHLVQLQDKIRNLENLSLSSQANRPSEPDVADPEFFSGERQRLTSFLSQCRLKFYAQPSKFTSESAKVMFAGSRLRGSAYSWFEPILASQSSLPRPELASFTSFAASLTSMYGDPDQRATAERQISECRQTTSTASYAADFKRLQSFIGWNNAALCHQFYSGLKENIKDKLAESERPASLDELISLCIRIDGRLHERRLEKSYRPTTSPLPRTTQSTTPQSSTVPTSWKPTAFAPQSMDLDATRPRFQKLTDEEKQRRRTLNLCLYCGKADHRANICPSRPKLNFSAKKSEVTEDSSSAYEQTFTIVAPTTQENYQTQE